jgi:predicted Zn-dependent protease
MSPDYKSRFEDALRIRDEGRLVEADEILSELEAENPEDPAIALIRAGVLFKLDKFKEAAELFGGILHSRLTTELASRGLFHALWKLGRYDEAFEEMKRFLAIADSEGYREFLDDINKDLRD